MESRYIRIKGTRVDADSLLGRPPEPESPDDNFYLARVEYPGFSRRDIRFFARDTLAAIEKVFGGENIVFKDFNGKYPVRIRSMYVFNDWEYDTGGLFKPNGRTVVIKNCRIVDPDIPRWSGVMACRGSVKVWSPDGAGEGTPGKDLPP